MVLGYKYSRYKNAKDFIKKNVIRIEFVKEFGMTPKEFFNGDLNFSDKEIIEMVLEKRKGKYLILYIENIFHILEVQE